MNAIYLFLDDEMGGLERDKHSLLQVYLLAVDSDLNKVDDLNLWTKPDDGNYCLTAQAMNVNKIDIVKHDTYAITYKEAGTKLYKWLQGLTNDGERKLIVVGHGVQADVDWILQHLISRGSFEKFTSYRKRDTSSIGGMLIDCGILPKIEAGLSCLATHFGIPFDENAAHDAKYDTEKTLAVFKALKERLLFLKSLEKN